MKKNQLKNFLKVLILFASIVSMISCEKNELEDLTNRKMSSENISTNKLLDELNNNEIIEFVSNSKYFTNSNELLKSNQSSVSNSYSPNFQKIVKPNEYITYSLRLNSYTSQKPYFKYFVINKEISGIEKAGFVKYIPSTPSHELDVDNFTGDIEIYNTDNELFAKTTFQNGQPTRNNFNNSNNTTFSSNYTVSSCYNVSYIIAHPCSHGGGHMPGESCNNGLANDAYYEIRTTIVCIDTIKSIVPPDTFSGGGGGGGGATILNLLNIPEPYEGEPSFSNESFMFYQQIFNFLQANPAYNNLVNHRYANNCLVSDWIVPKVVDYFRYNSFVEQQNQINVINAMNMFTNFLEIVSNQYNHEEMFINQFQTFQFLLQNSQWLSNQTNQTRQEIFNYLLSNNLNEQSRVFVKELIEDIINFPISEGNDGDAPDFNYDDYSNIQTQAQSLPNRNTFYNAFPKIGSSGMLASQVYQLIGGTVNNSRTNNPDSYQNACALRVSRALNYSGNPIPVFYNNARQQRTQKGADNLNYILDAASLLAYMKKTFQNSNPIHLVNKTPAEFKSAINGKWGIYIMLPKNTAAFGASGHADFWSNTGCLSGCHFEDAKEIYFWELF